LNRESSQSILAGMNMAGTCEDCANVGGKIVIEIADGSQAYAPAKNSSHADFSAGKISWLVLPPPIRELT